MLIPLSPPTKTNVEVNDEGSVHSFSIGMHGSANQMWMDSKYLGGVNLDIDYKK